VAESQKDSKRKGENRVTDFPIFVGKKGKTIGGKNLALSLAERERRGLKRKAGATAKNFDTPLEEKTHTNQKKKKKKKNQKKLSCHS